MSVKYRIPLMLAATMAVFAGFMYLFFLFYQNNVQQIIDQFTATTKEVVERVEQSGGPTALTLQSSMSEKTWPDRISILVTTEQNELAYLRNSVMETGINLRFSRQVTDRAGLSYRVTLEQNVDVDKVNVRMEIAKVALFSTALLLLTLVGVLLYLHRFVSRPLMALRKRMDALHGMKETESFAGGDEIVLLDQGFERMRMALESSRKARDEMVASISHDLRNPLTSILGYTERLLDVEETFPDLRTARYLHIIRDKAEDITMMLEEFHAYMEGEAGVLHPTLVDLSDFFRSVAEEYSEELAGMGHRFIWSSDLPPGTMEEIDAGKLRRVFSNLVANSVRHGGQIVCQEEHAVCQTGQGVGIRMSFHLEADEVVCVVADDGPGVPQEDLERIFGFMFRSGADRNRGRDKAGSGLGLTICKQIVTLHGGEITALKPAEGGFAVRFTLKRQKRRLIRETISRSGSRCPPESA